MDSGDSLSIKQINTERIRAFMEQAHSASKSQIARGLGLSFPTVTRLVDDLCAVGELLEQGAGSSTGGRCACYYQLNPRHRLYLLIQVEACQVCWNLKDLQENVVEHGSYGFTSISLERLDVLITDMAGRYRAINAIAIGIAALVNHGVVEEADAFSCLKGMDLIRHFREVTPLPVVIENDMDFLTLGCWSGRQPAADSLVTLFLNGPCMGGGMVVNRQLWTGSSGFCTEPTFLPGLESCWQGLASSPSDVDVPGLYARLIRIYAATVNPSMVILYANPLIEGKLDDIRRGCSAHLPAKAVPSIELSHSYQEDYERGLFALARKLS